jgi:putative DNA-invertase from lambdoid prophage Rac
MYVVSQKGPAVNRIAYYRVSTRDQSIEAQRAALGGGFAKEFSDEGISGATLAAKRHGFAALLSYIREGDELCVYAIDRLGRDALDVQATVRALLDKGVTVNVHGLGPIGRGVGELVVAVLAQVANMERDRIAERCDHGRKTAREALERTGQTHRGKAKFGRDFAGDPAAVRSWRQANGKSIAETAAQFGISPATVKRYCIDPLAAAHRADLKASRG